MVEITYTCMHVPELCQCAYHHRDFVRIERKTQFTDYKTAIHTVATWNCRDDCWVYAIKKVEVVPT